jgi:hypothetical protein
MGSSAQEIVKQVIKLSDKLLDALHDLKEEFSKRGQTVTKPREGPLPVVRSYHLDIGKKGLGVLSFDGGKVLLTRRLTALISILASDDGPSKDEFVAFKSTGTIAKLLEQRLGQKPAPPNVGNLIYQLRRRLEKRGGLSPWVVERSRLGARLRTQVATPGKEKSDGAHLVP